MKALTQKQIIKKIEENPNFIKILQKIINDDIDDRVIMEMFPGVDYNTAYDMSRKTSVRNRLKKIAEKVLQKIGDNSISDKEDLEKAKKSIIRGELYKELYRKIKEVGFFENTKQIDEFINELRKKIDNKTLLKLFREDYKIEISDDNEEYVSITQRILIDIDIIKIKFIFNNGNKKEFELKNKNFFNIWFFLLTFILIFDIILL